MNKKIVLWIIVIILLSFNASATIHNLITDNLNDSSLDSTKWYSVGSVTETTYLNLNTAGELIAGKYGNITQDNNTQNYSLMVKWLDVDTGNADTFEFGWTTKTNDPDGNKAGSLRANAIAHATARLYNSTATYETCDITSFIDGDYVRLEYDQINDKITLFKRSTPDGADTFICDISISFTADSTIYAMITGTGDVDIRDLTYYNYGDFYENFTVNILNEDGVLLPNVLYYINGIPFSTNHANISKVQFMPPSNTTQIQLRATDIDGNYPSNTENYSLSYTSHQEVNITLSSPYLNITIKDESTDQLITENVSMTFSTDSTEFTNYTTTGYFDTTSLGITAEYLILFTAGNYSPRTYTLTLGNLTDQTTTQLTAYLLANTSSTTLFTVIDRDTQDPISTAGLTMYRIINGTWKPVESKYTDITGKAQFTYEELENYKFFVSKTGYTDYIFYLNPIIYSEYNINLQKSSLLNYSQDYDGLAIIYDPSNFNNNTNTTFNFIISSPTGLLTSYGFQLISPDGGYSSASGNNAIGEQLSSSLTPKGTTTQDTVTLNYYYITAISGQRNFTMQLPINYIAGSSNMTFMANKDKTYGLGLFERMLICTLVVLFVLGIATMVGQPLPGFMLGLLVFGYMTYIGFIPLWGILPSIFIGVFFLMWKGGG